MLSKFRVLIVNDLLLIRKSLVSLLENQRTIEIAGECGIDEDLVALCAKSSPEIILMQAQKGIAEIFKKVRNVKAENPNIKVLLISEPEENNYLQFYRAGINGVINPNSSKTMLLKAIETVYVNDKFVETNNSGTEIFDLIGKIDPFLKKTKSSVKIKLTPREKEVLRLISQGLTSKQISEKLMLSRRTVDCFRGALIQKLHVKSTAGLIKTAITMSSETY